MVAMKELIINGTRHRVTAPDDQPLLSMLRDELDLTGTKYGRGEGQRGACTVLIDGEATRSCLTPVSAAAGKRITTVEGIEKNGKLHPLQQTFLRMVPSFRIPTVLFGLLLTVLGMDGAPVAGRTVSPSQDNPAASRGASFAATPAYQGETQDREIASLFAPVFYQGFGEGPRFDYITNFDFDGDWKGDNNWNNAANAQFKLKAYVYYSVSETQTHYFIHYALFHPRDYKGGLKRGSILSGLIREGAKLGGKYDPSGLSDEAVLAHENDLEGCLVVVRKRGDTLDRARTVYVETLAHNRFIKYVPERFASAGSAVVPMDGQRPELFVEPKGHGIESYSGDEKQSKDAVNGVRTYRFTGHADNPEKKSNGPIGYDLLPIYSTLWAHARGGENDTYGEAHSYSSVSIRTLAEDSGQIESQSRTGSFGSAFRGTVGAPNMARPPWGWFDSTEKDRPLGEWFFDPAGVVKRHYQLGDDFSGEYAHEPYLGVFRKQGA